MPLDLYNAGMSVREAKVGGNHYLKDTVIGRRSEMGEKSCVLGRLIRVWLEELRLNAKILPWVAYASLKLSAYVNYQIIRQKQTNAL